MVTISFYPVNFPYCLGLQFLDNEKRNGVPWKINIWVWAFVKVRWSHSKAVTRNGRFYVAGILNIVSQDLQASVGTLVGSCSIVVSMPILKCIQFSSIWEAGDPGTGRVTSGCNYTKFGSILNAEQQSWIHCWTEVGSDWMMEWFACEGCGISFLEGVQDSIGCGPPQPDLIWSK